MRCDRLGGTALAIVSVGLWLSALYAQGQGVQPVSITQPGIIQPIVAQPIDENRLVTLGGNTRPEATAKYDRGPVPDDRPMSHLLLLLKRSPEKERELEDFIQELHDPSSPQFHRWLTTRELGERFGLARQDRETIKNWLTSHGFKINVDYPNGLLIDFSGTAGQIRETFHTEIHDLVVNGETHIANMSDPRIPAALAPAIAGIVSLHDFRPHSHAPPAAYTVSGSGSTQYLIVPGDLATIYNLNPLFTTGISGQGQTIVVIEDSDVFTTDDWTSFRAAFGLSSYTDGSFTQIHPAPSAGANNCSDPGVIGASIEAIVDAEYASAAAPSAAIMLASCTSTTTFGGLIALQNLLNESATPPALVSMSYDECEAASGATSNAAFNATFQQAVAEGVSVFVAAGDNAAAGCDKFDEAAVFGIGVTGWGSSPHAVVVGGTDFGDTFGGTNSTYWSATNSATYESALSYVPEIPWNNSCASSLLAEFNGFSETFGSGSFCNSSEGNANFLNTVGGGGGPSECATGTPSTPGVVGGSCAGWPKPAYQTLLGNPDDGVRDLPDVSLFAANGVWLHAYPFCYSGTGGADCTEAPANWPTAGGTSFASPIMAGIQALVNQKAGARQGNPNFVYYKLAATEYGKKGSSACNSTLGNAVDSACIFYDVTQGDNDVPCVIENGLGTNDCYRPSGSIGVLSTSDTAFEPAYAATTGWDFATGIGTVNAYNLVTNWPSGFIFTATPNVTVIQAGQKKATLTIDPSNGFSGSVTFSASGLPSGVTAAFSPNPATTTSTITFTASATALTGISTVTITGTSGSLTATTTIQLKVKAAFTLSASPKSLSVVQGASGTSTITITPASGFDGSVTLSASPLPTGVTATFNPNPGTITSTLTLAASTSANTGTTPLIITGMSGGLTQTATIQLTVAAAPSFTLSASPATLSVVQGNAGTSTITVSPQNGFDGSVTFSASGLPDGVTAAFSPNPGTGSSVLTLTASATAATGTETITVTGVSGALTETTSIQLTVTPSPTFTLAASPGSLNVAQGSSGTSTITITPANGFNGSVTLSAAGLPTGVTATFGTNPATSTSVLTLAASATAATGAATVTISGTSSGTSGTLTASTSIQLAVTAAPSFTLSASPGSLNVVQGNSGASTITVTPANGFNGSVTLSASGLPTGVTATFGTNPATSTSVLTLAASATAATGAATVTISGTSGTLTASTTIQLTVTAVPSFSLQASPVNLSLLQGNSAASTITISPVNGFNGSVTFSASGLPSGVTASFSPNPATSTSSVTFTASTTATPGTTTVTVMGTSGSLTATTSIQVTVAPPPTFTLSASPGSVSVVQGTSGASTITITPANGFNGSVTLSASGLPSGVTATFATNPATSTSLLTLAASSTATTGTATVTISGTSAGLAATATIQLIVTPSPSFTLAASPDNLSLVQGTKRTSTITVTPANGFSGSVTFSASGLPSGITATFSPNPGTSSSVVTLTASATATTGTTVITITGTSANLTATTTIQLTITPSPSFKLSASPSTVTVVEGSSGTSTIVIDPENGFSGNVTFSASGLPSGVTAAFSPNPATNSTTVTLSASAGADTGMTTVTVTGVSGSLSQTVKLALTVKPSPSYTLSASPTALTIVQGSSGTSTVTITPANGFDGSVTLTASNLPSGVTAAFNPNPTSSTTTLTLTAVATAAPGTTAVNLTGTSGNLTVTTTIQLTVQAAYVLSASPGTLSVVQGLSGTSNITIAPASGFTGSVTFSASGLPSGVTAQFSANPSSTGSTLTLTAAPTATTGTTAVTITGMSGNFTESTTIALTVLPLGSFTLKAAPSPVTVSRGSSGTTSITVVPSNGFDQPVNLAVAGLPAGVTASLSPNPATATSTLTLKVSSSAATGISTITVTGTFESLSNGVGIGLIIQ